ncbi:MAG: LysR substrate-binding domain-containing protein [Burkholderiales bacterium]|nr:LysR substrate-binding domain-containing protein [Burkholderiales bacterium]
MPRAPFDPSRMGREFVIGTTDYGVMTVLSRAISAVTAKSPDSTVRAVLTDQADVVRQLDSSAIDLAVGAGGFARWPRRIEVLHLFDERFVGIARVGHPCLKPGRGGPRVGLECFLSWPHVLVSPGGDTRGAVDEVLAASGRSRRIASTSPSFISAPFVVGATDLLAVVPEKLGSTLASAAGIAIFELPLDMAPWSVGIGRLVSRAAEPEIAWLTERLQESAAQA